MARFLRRTQVLACGAVLLQAGGCTFEMVNEFIQTVLLGVTAAGAVAILNNV